MSLCCPCENEGRLGGSVEEHLPHGDAMHLRGYRDGGNHYFVVSASRARAMIFDTSARFMGSVGPKGVEGLVACVGVTGDEAEEGGRRDGGGEGVGRRHVGELRFAVLCNREAHHLQQPSG